MRKIESLTTIVIDDLNSVAIKNEKRFGVEKNKNAKWFIFLVSKTESNTQF